MTNRLGPYELNTIVTGDARDLIKAVPDESIDLIVTSPPYNLGNNHHTGNFRHQQYNDDLPEAIYQGQQIEMLNHLYRTIKPAGSLLYNHKNRIKDGVTITPYEWILKTGWIIKQELVWFNGSQNFDKVRFYPMTERVYWLVKCSKTQLYNAINHHDLFEWRAVGSGGNHTRAFPEQMVMDLLSCFPDARIVLDPYAGRGTVAAVCKILNLDYLAFEVEPETAEQARARVLLTQAPLFVMPELEQLEMLSLQDEA